MSEIQDLQYEYITTLKDQLKLSKSIIQDLVDTMPETAWNGECDLAVAYLFATIEGGGDKAITCDCGCEMIEGGRCPECLKLIISEGGGEVSDEQEVSDE